MEKQKEWTHEEIMKLAEENYKKNQEQLAKMTPEEREKRLKSWERLVKRMEEEVS